MTEMTNSPNCERSSDLIAFLYDEADEREKRDFQLHLKECVSCRAEVASFGNVRESISTWRDEVLAGFVSTQVATTTTRKSALAALRQFFDLSPLWLKGATAFAVLAFLVLAGLAFVKLQNGNSQITQKPGAIYTPEEADRMVQEAVALAKRTKNAEQPVKNAPDKVVKENSPKLKKSRAATSSEFARSRRPLSRAEREQLAADLRLLSGREDATLNLLGDRINQ